MSEPSSKLFRDDPAAYYTELGAELERERIIRLLTNIEIKLDAMRPESYKKVSDMADLRIRTIRTMIALIEREAE